MDKKEGRGGQEWVKHFTTPWKSLKMESKVVCRSIFTGNLKNRVAKKLHSIILIHFGLKTFRFTIPTAMKVLMCMVFGITGHDHGSLKP